LPIVQRATDIEEGRYAGHPLNADA
jgi:hypothetical protein